MDRSFFDGRVFARTGDITKETVDAIVNAANSTLLGGGGVDGAIHRAGGPEILEECRAIRKTQFQNGLPTGDAVITGGGRLPAQFVIHTVGPIYGENSGRDAELLSKCYSSSLDLLVSRGLTSIAFPAISTGVYGYPKSEAAAVASQAVASFLSNNDTVRDVRFIFFNARDLDIFVDNCTF